MSEDFSTQSSEISLRDYADLLRRRKYIVLQTFVLVIMVGTIVTYLTKPTYRTIARILVEGREFTLAQYNTSDPLSTLFMPDAGHDISTQIEVLQSARVMSDAFQSAGVSPADVHVDIKQVGNTDVIEIVTESNKAEYAERMARVLPTVYKNYMAGNRKTEVVTALSSSRDRLNEEKQKLSQAEYAIQKFKQKTHLPDVALDKTSRIGEANSTESEAKRAQADVASAAARLNTLQADRKRQPDFIDTPTTISNNAALQTAKDQLSQLRNERVRLLAGYKPGTFEINQVDTQIAQAEQRLNDTPPTVTSVSHAPNPILSSYDQKVSEAQATLNAAQAQLDKAQSHATEATAKLGKFSTLDRQQAELQRNLEEHQANVKTLTTTVQMLDLRDKATHDPLMTITPAGPAFQVAPRPVINMIYSAVVGLILALGLALLQEFMDDRVNSPDDARRMLDTPVLGYVPLIEKEEGRLLSQTRSNGAILESYRVVRSNVQFATLGSQVCSLLVTSTVPGEGKSVTATNLAIAMALDGKKVILVDADLRRSTVHQKFDIPQSPGLTNVLIGRTSLEAALRDTEFPGLRLLTAGPQPPNPAELLNSEPMQRLHERLKEYADVVIYDSPPCLATADAQVLSASVDGVMYVIQLGETKKSGVRHAMELLNQAHANVLGVIFNKVRANGKQSGYYDYYGYYGYYGSVYGEDGSRKRVSSEFEALLADSDEEPREPAAAILPPAETRPAQSRSGKRKED